MKKFLMLLLATAAAAVMGGDPAREAEEYCRKGHEYFINDDYPESLKCYQRAAALGSAAALFEVGLFYKDGWGGEKNPELAQKYFSAAEPGLLKLAEQDDTDAQLAVAYLKNSNYWLERAMSNFRAAAARGDAYSKVKIGSFYQHVKKDLPEALKWYRRAAEQGHPEAAFFVGVRYAKGMGVKPDADEALKWFHIAADRGYTFAEFVIAEHYEFDKKDMEEAMKWYRRSAEHGNKLAQWSLRERNKHPEKPWERITAISHAQTDPAPADY